MTEEVAIVIGIAVLLFIFFELWDSQRDRHPNLALLFFGFGLGMILSLAYTIFKIVEENASYLGDFGFTLFTMVMWGVVGVVAYIMLMTIFYLFKMFANTIASTLGWRVPFKENKLPIIWGGKNDG